MNFQAALTYGLPGARVAKALADWQVNELPGEYYQMLNASGEDIGLLAFSLCLRNQPWICFVKQLQEMFAKHNARLEKLRHGLHIRVF